MKAPLRNKKRISHMIRGAAFLLVTLFLIFPSQSSAEPRNIILLIGDGMGYEHVKAAGMFGYGSEGTLFFESFSHQGQVTTYSADSAITDSAAAATAMATATKVNNGVISEAYPGDGGPLYTLLEYFRDAGKSTGLVTTAPITHATPAAFGAHEPSRNNMSEIANDYLQQTRPNVLFGSGENGMSLSAAEAAGYTVITTKSSLLGLNTDFENMVSGQFAPFPYEYDGYGGSLPHLSEMVAAALDILENDADGFFLMVEGGQIDWAGHINDIQRDIYETLEFENTVQVVYDWALDKPDTLVIVTADHETGGLQVLQNNGAGSFPSVSWSTTGHTGVNVPIYAFGENSQLISGTINNTDLFGISTSTSTTTIYYYCDSDADGYTSSSASGSCSGTGCEPVACDTFSGNDCDDSSGSTYPGAAEDCLDGIDNDCDGLVDDTDPDAENCLFVCTDNDNDNFSVEGGECGAVDCNDSDSAINPNACDILNDGIDQDCNGKDRTKGKPCSGTTIDPEICDDGIDNDLDGKIDCADKQDCGKDPLCERGGSSDPEICDDGIDNDRDGKTDCSDKKDCGKAPVCNDPRFQLSKKEHRNSAAFLQKKGMD